MERKQLIDRIQRTTSAIDFLNLREEILRHLVPKEPEKETTRKVVKVK